MYLDNSFSLALNYVKRGNPNDVVLFTVLKFWYIPLTSGWTDKADLLCNFMAK